MRPARVCRCVASTRLSRVACFANAPGRKGIWHRPRKKAARSSGAVSMNLRRCARIRYSSRRWSAFRLACSQLTNIPRAGARHGQGAGRAAAPEMIEPAQGRFRRRVEPKVVRQFGELAQALEQLLRAIRFIAGARQPPTKRIDDLRHFRVPFAFPAGQNWAKPASERSWGARTALRARPGPGAYRRASHTDRQAPRQACRWRLPGT